MIERVLVDDKVAASAGDYFTPALQPKNSLDLPPDYHRVVFDFTVLTFSSPEDARFRYRLEGFDDTWTEITEPRRAFYPRLPAGKYRFRVSAANADGVWNDAGATTSITGTSFGLL